MTGSLLGNGLKWTSIFAYDNVLHVINTVKSHYNTFQYKTGFSVVVTMDPKCFIIIFGEICTKDHSNPPPPI